MITKQHLKTISAISKDSFRPVLEYMRVTTNREKGEIKTVATNSFILIEQTSTNHDVNDGQYFMSASDVKKAELDFKGLSKNLPENTPLEPKDVHYIPQVESSTKYPKYERVLPTAPPDITVQLDVKLLQDLLKAYAPDKKDNNIIELQVYKNPTSPIVIKANRAGCDILGLIMPIRKD